MPSITIPPPAGAEVRPRKLIFIGRYAVLDEHSLPATADHPAITVDAQRLQIISNNANRREQATGDCATIVLGHTDDDLTEEQQPKTVGLIKNCAVEPLFDTGRMAIWADFYIFDDCLDEARDYPRRSVELWAGRNEIDPVSLLKITPERDLGLMLYSRTDEKPYHYSLEDRMADNKTKDDDKKPSKPKDDDKKPSDDTKSDKADAPKDSDDADGASDPLVAKVLAALMQTDAWKKQEAVTDKLMELIESMDGGAAPGGDEQDAGAGAGAMMPPPDAGAQLMPASGPSAAPAAPEAAKYNEPPPVRFDAGCASGSNSYVPEMNDEKTKYERPQGDPSKDDADFKVRLSRVEAENQRKNAEVADLRRQLDEEKLRYRRDNARNHLDRLEAEGFVVEKDEEFKILEVMTPEAQAKHAERVRKYYKQAPIAKSGSVDAAIDASRSAGEKRGPASTTEVRDLADKARIEGLSYDEALKKHYGV